MNIIKLKKAQCIEILSITIIYVILISNAVLVKDSIISLISAFCGITYTIWAGKGNPICYIFGVIGSGFYAYLSFKNALWGNCLLYACYYIPMQILGFFQWKKNMKNETEVIKKSLTLKENIITWSLTLFVIIFAIFILDYTNSHNPLFDGITTTLSVLGMFLTVKRCVEQWIAWFIVNSLSLIMWLKIVLMGEKAYSTLIMWFIYTLLAVYFYFQWRKEINLSKLN